MMTPVETPWWDDFCESKSDPYDHAWGYDHDDPPEDPDGE